MKKYKMSIFLYGCGGHGKVILDIFLKQNKKVVAIVDDKPPQNMNEIHGVPIYQTDYFLAQIQPSDGRWIVSVGNNSIRKKIANKLSGLGYSFTTAIHPSAEIGLGVKIGVGTVIMANAFINIDSYIGDHCIINTGSTVDHDCHIDDYCHIAPGCSVCGQVTLGKQVLLGVGSSIKPLMKIGQNTMCGAGSVIVKSLPPNCLAYGSPAKVIKYFNQ